MDNSIDFLSEDNLSSAFHVVKLMNEKTSEFELKVSPQRSCLLETEKL